MSFLKNFEKTKLKIKFKKNTPKAPKRKFLSRKLNLKLNNTLRFVFEWRE